MTTSNSTPRILILADTAGWALDTIALATSQHGTECDITIAYLDTPQGYPPGTFDVIHVLWSKATDYKRFMHEKTLLIKSVYSHTWIEDGTSVSTFCDTYLRDADIVTVPSALLYEAIQEHVPHIELTPEGVDTSLFFPSDHPRTGPMVVGWAGNPTRAIKRFDWVRQACDGLCVLHVADGNMSSSSMPAFYRDVDVICCASVAEGAPRMLLEGMACGAYPVCFPVGIAPELVQNVTLGNCSDDESIEGLRRALRECIASLETIRSTRYERAHFIQETRQFSTTLDKTYALYRV